MPAAGFAWRHQGEQRRFGSVTRSLKVVTQQTPQLSWLLSITVIEQIVLQFEKGQTKMKRFALSLVAALSMAAVATTAFATDTVTQNVTPGTRTASVANLSLGSVAYSRGAQTPTGSMTLTADDSTGSNAG